MTLSRSFRLTIAFWATYGIGVAFVSWVVEVARAWSGGNALGVIWFALLALVVPFKVVEFWYELFRRRPDA